MNATDALTQPKPDRICYEEGYPMTSTLGMHLVVVPGTGHVFDVEPSCGPIRIVPGDLPFLRHKVEQYLDQPYEDWNNERRTDWELVEELVGHPDGD